MIYVAGSLKILRPRQVADTLRLRGHYVFDDWHACGPNADAEWRQYEQDRGHSFREALDGEFAENTFRFDLARIQLCHTFILVLPAGKSGHMELMYAQGIGKRGIVFMDEEPTRDWDMMYRFIHHIVVGETELFNLLEGTPS